jgi:hypothetical protein
VVEALTGGVHALAKVILELREQDIRRDGRVPRRPDARLHGRAAVHQPPERLVDLGLRHAGLVRHAVAGRPLGNEQPDIRPCFVHRETEPGQLLDDLVGRVRHG